MAWDTRLGGDDQEVTKPQMQSEVSTSDLRRMAHQIAPGAFDVDDLVQEARIAAWRAGDDARAPRSWIAGVMRNRAVSRWRSRERRRRREQAVAESGSVSTPEARAQLEQQLQRLAAALRALDPTDRRLVVGRYYEERSAPELAAELGLRPSTARTRLSRAVARLRRELGVEAEPLFERLSAWLPLGWLPSPLKTASITMNSAKLGLAAAAIVATTIAWTYSSADESSAATTTAAGPEDGAATPPPTAGTPHPVDASAAAPPSAKVSGARGVEARAVQSKAASSEPEPEPGAMLARYGLPIPSNPDAAAMLELIVDTNRQIAEELEVFNDCLVSLGGRDEGRLVLEGTLVGEPDVAMVFDDVSVTEDTIGDAATDECMRESLRSVEMRTPRRAYYQRYRYVFDFGTGRQRIEAMPTVEQSERLRAVYADIDATPYAYLIDDEADQVAFSSMPGRTVDPRPPSVDGVEDVVSPADGESEDAEGEDR
ncbi:MAG: sigma-70 family RNA polymerase sigma factor [Myxococcota bacterium]